MLFVVVTFLSLMYSLSLSLSLARALSLMGTLDLRGELALISGRFFKNPKRDLAPDVLRHKRDLKIHKRDLKIHKWAPATSVQLAR